jgi:hypothetical protein
MAVQVDKEQFDIDRKGIVKFTVRWRMDTRIEAIRNVPRQYDGVPLDSVRGTPWIAKNGDYLVDAVYMGAPTEWNAGFDEDERSQDQYELVTEEREVSIKKFPDRDFLREKYGMYFDFQTGDLLFPEQLPAEASRIGAPLTLDTMKKKPGATRPNPLFGTTTYPVPYTVARWTLVRRRVPRRLEEQAMTVIDQLPKGFQWDGPRIQWYVRPLQKRKVGNLWEIEWKAEELSEFKDAEFLNKIKEFGRKTR